MLHERITHTVIECAMNAHTALGAGMLESTYHACLQHEFIANDLHFGHQVRLPVN